MNTTDAKFTIQSIDLPTGITLEYVERGDPSGVPTLLLHGITDSWRSFELALPRLPTSIHAFALSQRGHGGSDRPGSGYELLNFAEDVASFMDAMKLERALIAGHSMGSQIALRFALDFPERVLGLALIGSFFSPGGNAAVKEFGEVVSTLDDPIDYSFALEFQQSTLAKEIPKAYLEAVTQESLKVPARVWRAALKGILESNHSTDLGKIKAPTLILWGDQDAFCPRADQDALAQAIPYSRLIIYRGVGHALHWEEPARFANELAAFTANLTGKRT
jgi:pimeloyl-ACP methyl ester carboxylesterase